jgi:hypothetical protein
MMANTAMIVLFLDAGDLHSKGYPGLCNMSGLTKQKSEIWFIMTANSGNHDIAIVSFVITASSAVIVALSMAAEDESLIDKLRLQRSHMRRCSNWLRQ